MGQSNGKARSEIARRELMMAAGGTMLAAGIGGGTALAETGPSPAPSPIKAPAPAAPGTIAVERRGAILLIGINRPQAQNRMDPPMLIGLGKAYHRLEHDDSLRVAVLDGLGPDFCKAISGEDAALQALLPAYQQLLQSADAKEARQALSEGRKPVFRGL